jgi:hypothetical protein
MLLRLRPALYWMTNQAMLPRAAHDLCDGTAPRSHAGRHRESRGSTSNTRDQHLQQATAFADPTTAVASPSPSTALNTAALCCPVRQVLVHVYPDSSKAVDEPRVTVHIRRSGVGDLRLHLKRHAINHHPGLVTITRVPMIAMPPTTCASSSSVRPIGPTAVAASGSLDVLEGQGLLEVGVMVLPLRTEFTLDPPGNTAQTYPAARAGRRRQRARWICLRCSAGQIQPPAAAGAFHHPAVGPVRQGVEEGRCQRRRRPPI